MYELKTLTNHDLTYEPTSIPDDSLVMSGPLPKIILEPMSRLLFFTETQAEYNARGCTNNDQDEWRVASGTVTNAPMLEAFVNQGDVVKPACHGDENAKVTIRAQGGTADYWFSSDGENYDQIIDEEWGGTHIPYILLKICLEVYQKRFM